MTYQGKGFAWGTGDWREGLGGNYWLRRIPHIKHLLLKTWLTTVPQIFTCRIAFRVDLMIPTLLRISWRPPLPTMMCKELGLSNMVGVRWVGWGICTGGAYGLGWLR